MLSVKSAMMRWPLGIPRSARLRWRKSALSCLDTSAPWRPLSSARMSSRRCVTISPLSSAWLSIMSMIFPNQTKFGWEFSGHWQKSSKFSKPIWIWFGICALQHQFFHSKQNWNWFGKSYAIFGCNFSKPNWIWFGKEQWMKCSVSALWVSNFASSREENRFMMKQDPVSTMKKTCLAN